MPSPHPAVTPASITIAKKYGKSVSKGIAEMQRCIEVLEKANKEKGKDIKRARSNALALVARYGNLES